MKNKGNIDFPLKKQNFRLLFISLAILVLGYILMSGGDSPNPHVFNPRIFDARRITVAPIVVLIGYFLLIYAIVMRPKKEKEESKRIEAEQREQSKGNA